jgi:hypothetical protein
MSENKPAKPSSDLLNMRSIYKRRLSTNWYIKRALVPYSVGFVATAVLLPDDKFNEYAYKLYHLQFVSMQIGFLPALRKTMRGDFDEKEEEPSATPNEK